MTDKLSPDQVKKRAGIQSVEIGMRVLGALAELGGASPLVAIVRKCGLSPSQTHRYLASLSASGMARQNANGTYDLGPGALKLGMSALARLDIFKIADEEIETFTAETGATVLLAVLGPGGPTIVRWHTGSPPVVTSLAVGSVLSIPHSATGQVFLAYRSENDTKAFLAAELAKEPKLDLESVANLKQKVRDEGMALVGGTLIPGLNAIACPILNLQSQAVIVATVVSTGQLRRADTEIGKRLKQVCAKINAIVGGHPDLLA